MSKKSSTFAPDFDENHYLRRFYATRRDGGIGRHEGLKILWPVMAVWVQVPLAVQRERPFGVALLLFNCQLLEFKH